MQFRSLFIPLSMMLASGFTVLPAVCEEGTAAAEGGAGSGAPASGSSQSVWEKDPSAWKVTIYPIYGWLPVFGAHLNLPTVPGNGSGSGGSSGPSESNVSGSFNGAGFAGFDIEKSRVTASGSFLYAAISGDSTNPKAHLGLDIFFGQVMGGYKILKEVDLEGGVRRMSLNIHASVGDRPEVSTKPGIWDPLIGMTWKHPMGRKWLLTTHLDGGGFGVGSDVTLAGGVRADWRFAKHFGVTMGVSALHFQMSNTYFDQTRLERTINVRQTLYGPVFGFGMYF